MVLPPDACRVIHSPSMAARTSIGLGGEAIAEVRVRCAKGIEGLPGLLDRLGGQVRLIGEGSNVIAADGRLPLVLLNYERHGAPVVVGERENEVVIRVEAGTRLPALLAWAARAGLSGLEGLAGIPGSVGGAVAMNAGSFGVETASAVRAVELFSPVLGLVSRPAADFAFSYRGCALPGHESWFLITRVTLAFARGRSEDIRARMREIHRKKRLSQPVAARSAGCVFKNPAPDAPAGRLLEEAGLKGYSIGGMSFSALHANFLVNGGKGVFAQAMELVDLARERVRERSGHQLELEVRIWR